MLKATIRRYYTLLGGQAGLRSWQTAQNIGIGTWRRNLTVPSQPLMCSVSPKRLASIPARPSITNSLPRSRSSPLRTPRRNFHNTSRRRDANNSTYESSAKDAKAKEPQGLSARLKKLSREYGWSAVGVYLGLSVLDFPFCFLLVRIVGTDKIGEFEHFVVSNVKKAIPQSAQDKWHEYRKALKESRRQNLGDDLSEDVEMAGWGVEEAEARNQVEASLGTQLALAYAIHKSFIFIRVPLTAAITPKVVKVLRSWGWDIGKRKAKTSMITKP